MMVGSPVRAAAPAVRSARLRRPTVAIMTQTSRGRRAWLKPRWFSSERASHAEMGAMTTAPAAAQADTIFAPATAAGRAGIAVVRISGPAAAAAHRALVGAAPGRPRRARLAALRDPA